MIRPDIGTRRSATQRGVVAVELAVILPVLMVLLLAAAELGRLMYQYNTLTKANRDGARYAAGHAAFGSTGVIIVDPSADSPWSRIVSDTRNLVSCGYTSCASKTPVLPALGTGDVSVSSPDPLHVTVSVSYTYQPWFGPALEMFGIGPDVNLVVPLRATTTMRAL